MRSIRLQATSENTIIFFVCPPIFCISIVSSFSWDLKWPQEKTKTMLMQNLGAKTKSIMVFSEMAYLVAQSPGLCLKVRAGPETTEQNRKKMKLLAFECTKLIKIATMVNCLLARGSPLMQGLLNQNKSDGYICLMHSGVKNKSLQTEQVTKYKKTKLRRLFVS